MDHIPEPGVLDRTLAYRHAGVCDKLVEELRYTPEAAERLFEDTLRFLALAGDPKTRARTMALATKMGYTVNRVHVCIAPTRAIDEAWHRFVLFTHDYARFCDAHFRKFLHHQPIANPAQLEEVVRGDDLIRIAQTIYGDDLDLTNWQGDSTNSGTCCVEESANCGVCWDSGGHCYACCSCTVCMSFRERCSAAHRAWQETESRRSSAEYKLERPRRELDDGIQKKKGWLRARHHHLAQYRREIRGLEPQLAKLQREAVDCERELAGLERDIPELEAKLPSVRSAVARERAGAYRDIEASAHRAKAAYEHLVAAHRTALTGKTKRSS